MTTVVVIERETIASVLVVVVAVVAAVVTSGWSYVRCGRKGSCTNSRSPSRSSGCIKKALIK
eukprot:9087662-Pyramimonas_sp.AAC.1